MFVSVETDTAGAEAAMMEVSCCRFSERVGNSDKSHKNTSLGQINLDVKLLEIEVIKDRRES